MFAELKLAFRSLLKSPGFTLTAVLTLAVAIGACTTLFSALEGAVLKPLPYGNPDSVIARLAPEVSLQQTSLRLQETVQRFRIDPLVILRAQ